jgi:hypothetical protein
MSNPLDALLDFCRANGRVCPAPMRWNELYGSLPGTRREGLGWEPPLPLILAAWHEASNSQKQERFESHLRWAEDHGALEPIAKFLHSLDEADWHHFHD